LFTLKALNGCSDNVPRTDSFLSAFSLEVWLSP